jgi:hypothetical protein
MAQYYFSQSSFLHLSVGNRSSSALPVGLIAKLLYLFISIFLSGIARKNGRRTIYRFLNDSIDFALHPD